MSYPAPKGYRWEFRPVQHHGYTDEGQWIDGVKYVDCKPIFTYGWVLVKERLL